MLIDSHGQPLDPKLRRQIENPTIGWLVCKVISEGVYQPVVDPQTRALGIAPTAEQAAQLAQGMANRELTPRPGTLVAPGQESSVWAVIRLVGEGIVQVKIDPADKLLKGGHG